MYNVDALMYNTYAIRSYPLAVLMWVHQCPLMNTTTSPIVLYWWVELLIKSSHKVSFFVPFWSWFSILEPRNVSQRTLLCYYNPTNHTQISYFLTDIVNYRITIKNETNIPWIQKRKKVLIEIFLSAFDKS